MLKTVLWLLFFWLVMVLTLPFYIWYIVLRIVGLKKLARKYSQIMVSLWSRFIIFSVGGRVTIEGYENLPEGQNICFISNHQGAADIPLILGYIPRAIGFIARKRMAKIPILTGWMKTIHCLFIERDKISTAKKAFERGVVYIKNGLPMLIFPEGTRRKGPGMSPFRRGSFKLALQADALIVPITVSGTYKLFEEKGRISGGHIYMHIHSPIDVSQYSGDERKKIIDKVQDIISKGLVPYEGEEENGALHHNT